MELNLTHKQTAIYRFIQEYIEENHRPPSLREIGDHLDLSVGTVQDQVEAIRRKGFLTKDPTKARGLRLPITAQQVPILGRVHAGPLHAAIENVEGYLPVGAQFSPSKHFALKVRGDSMIEAGILEGDMVIVRVQATAENGDIVVARVEDEATVKRLRRRGERTILEPANPAYTPLEGPFSLLGVVVEVRRQYKK
ncbi:MAG: LexA repressor [Elusimicrobia bacterium]|nr:LexA repressor [Elusimicrobiota bacterium]